MFDILVYEYLITFVYGAMFFVHVFHLFGIIQ